MGMFYVMYLGNECNFSQLKQRVIEIIPSVRSKTDVGDKFDVNCEYFSLSLKEGGTQVKFRSEDYNDKFDFQFWFDVHYTNPSWAVELMKFVGGILKSFDGNCVLESNGDTPIVRRKDNTIIVDNSKLKSGTQGFPFGSLELEYQEGYLESV